MKSVLQLDKMRRLEKLQAMEELWRNLSRPDEEFESPNWHDDVLREREKNLREGKDKFIPCEEAKRELRQRRE